MTERRACSVDGCDGKYLAKGFCQLHYHRTRSGIPLNGRRIPKRYCSADGCFRDHLAKGLCGLHWDRAKREELARLHPCPPRLCLDCKTDISARGVKSVRCVTCRDRFSISNRLSKRDLLIARKPDRTCVGCGGTLMKTARCNQEFCSIKCQGKLSAILRNPECSHPSCLRPAAAKGGGYCGLHKQRLRLGKNMNAPPGWAFGRVCSVSGCDQRHAGLGFCITHWNRYKKGDRGQKLCRPILVRHKLDQHVCRYWLQSFTIFMVMVSA